MGKIERDLFGGVGTSSVIVSSRERGTGGRTLLCVCVRARARVCEGGREGGKEGRREGRKERDRKFGTSTNITSMSLAGNCSEELFS